MDLDIDSRKLNQSKNLLYLLFLWF